MVFFMTGRMPWCESSCRVVYIISWSFDLCLMFLCGLSRVSCRQITQILVQGCLLLEGDLVISPSGIPMDGFNWGHF